MLRDYAASVSQPTLAFAGAGEPRYDEVVDDGGALRSGWKALAEHALALTADDLRRIDGEITRFLADDGVSYVRADAGADGGAQRGVEADVRRLLYRVVRALVVDDVRLL